MQGTNRNEFRIFLAISRPPNLSTPISEFILFICTGIQKFVPQGNTESPGVRNKKLYGLFLT